MLLDCLNVDVTKTRALLQHVVGFTEEIFKTDAIDQNNPYKKYINVKGAFIF